MGIDSDTMNYKHERNDTIVNNFFIYLNKAKVNQLKYENDNNLPKGTLSKWKAKKVNIGIEQMYQAAQYFGVTPNDLFYSNEEKIEISNLVTDDYKPIEASKLQDVKVVFPTIKQSYKHICYFIILSIVILFALPLISINLLLIYPIVMIVVSLLFSLNIYLFSPKKTFSVNYLDDIGFILKDNINKNYSLIRNIKIISILLFLSSIVINFYLLYNCIDIDDMMSIFFFINSISTIFCFIYNVYCLATIPKKYDKVYRIYNDPFKKILFLVFLSISNFVLASLFLIFLKTWLLFLVSLIILILCLTELLMLRSKMLKYRFMCEEYDGDIIELYPN